jgi:hypothetical protein
VSPHSDSAGPISTHVDVATPREKSVRTSTFGILRFSAETRGPFAGKKCIDDGLDVRIGPHGAKAVVTQDASIDWANFVATGAHLNRMHCQSSKELELIQESLDSLLPARNRCFLHRQDMIGRRVT